MDAFHNSADVSVSVHAFMESKNHNVSHVQRQMFLMCLSLTPFESIFCSLTPRVNDTTETAVH
jgi:hypothetical protein